MEQVEAIQAKIEDLSETLKQGKKRKREQGDDSNRGALLLQDLVAQVEMLKNQLTQISNGDRDEMDVQPSSDLIGLNVGGTVFQVLKENLLKEHSMFTAMLKGELNTKKDGNGNIFIDRDPTMFNYILNYLRNGKEGFTPPTKEADRNALFMEADFYGILGLIGFFQGKEARSRSIPTYLSEMKKKENVARQEIVNGKSAVFKEDPYYFLIDVFDEQSSFVNESEDSISQFFEQPHKAPIGEPSICSSVEEFYKNFDAFTQGMFNGFNWDNVFIAGGSVLACLMPVSKEVQEIHELREYYQNNSGFEKSDIDLFLYGLDEEKAIKKIEDMYKFFSSKTEEISALRTNRTVTFLFDKPNRLVQIILRLYSAPAEVLLGFDLDCVGFGADGTRVWCLPRSRWALNNKCNLADPSRQTYRTTSYEFRLWKYSKRGFSVGIPGYMPRIINPKIYSTPYHKLSGFAKLMMLEIRENLSRNTTVNTSKDDILKILKDYNEGIVLDGNTVVEMEYDISSIVSPQCYTNQGYKLNVIVHNDIRIVLCLDGLPDLENLCENMEIPYIYEVALPVPVKFIGSLEEYIISLPDVDDNWFSDI
eukprot:TRINITY_DN7680_c0_g1_i1.p1 TRINITY_DN7680_c0_g1~~TRINITY_DN7680_c0_g1_i1.p1  ORF type:complete len:591 (-),score=138.85 TRINITY_DN7680_c0_g1_i1:60-1832(-)